MHNRACQPIRHMRSGCRCGEYPRITYVARSFLDYRIPVFQALDALCEKRLSVIFSTLWSPQRVQQKAVALLGERAIALPGEKSIGDNMPHLGMANRTVCIPHQPGLLKTIASTDPDILIGDGFFQWTGLALPYRIRTGVPLVVCYERTFHTERYAQWYRTLYRKAAMRWIDAMCCNGRLCMEYTKWLGMPEERITTGHMAADTQNLSLQIRSITPEQKDDLRKELSVQGVVYIYVGQLIERKGIHELLQAWAQFSPRQPDSGTLLVIGGGDSENALLRLASSLKLESVRFVGPVDYDSIARYYAVADVFVMPTLEDNWSLVVPEAMACGLPVLTSKYNGCWPELVHPGVNGWVFDPLDCMEFSHRLQLCLEHRDNLKSMGEKSRQIIQRHSPERAAQSIFQACRIALRRAQSRRRVAD